MGKLKDLYAYIQFALALGPGLMNLVKHIEEISAAEGVVKAGAQKAGLILAFVTSAAEMAPDDVKATLHLDKLTAWTQKLIDVIVTFFNTAGIFKKP
jgi:hypothetical protein